MSSLKLVTRTASQHIKCASAQSSKGWQSPLRAFLGLSIPEACDCSWLVQTCKWLTACFLASAPSSLSWSFSQQVHGACDVSSSGWIACSSFVAAWAIAKPNTSKSLYVPFQRYLIGATHVERIVLGASQRQFLLCCEVPQPTAC